MPAVPNDDPGLYEGLPTAGRSLADLMAVLARRKGAMLLAFLGLAFAALVVALALPAVYRSTATILIKEQEIPQELVRSTVTSYADERIQVISQQVMTRATLLALVDKYGLYGKARQRETSEEILDRMRRDIRLTPISADVTDRRTGSQVRATIAFTLSYDSEVAGNAQKIANELTTLFLNENVKNRQQKAAETTSFLDEELARISGHISEVEQRLASFKRRNQGSTPDLGLSNLMNSERLATELQRVEREATFLGDRKLALEAQLADTRAFLPGGSSPGVVDPEQRLRSVELQLAGMAGTYSDDHPDVKRLRREIANLRAEVGPSEDTAGEREQQLTRLKDQLTLLRRKYSDDHPDVVQLRRTYALLEQSMAAAAASAPRAGSGTRRPDNPAYLALKTQIETTASQIESLRSERAELLARQQRVEVRLSQTPEVERAFLELTRDLDSSRARFRELRDKQMQAQVAEQLERERKAERFTIIEPPMFPERPYRPNRPLILSLGLLLALLGAFGAAALAEALDATVHGPRDVVRAMQVPVLCVLPALPDSLSATRRTRALVLGAGAAVVAAAAAAALVHAFVMPLDVAWFSLLRRIAD